MRRKGTKSTYFDILPSPIPSSPSSRRLLDVRREGAAEARVDGLDEKQRCAEEEGKDASVSSKGEEERQRDKREMLTIGNSILRMSDRE